MCWIDGTWSACRILLGPVPVPVANQVMLDCAATIIVHVPITAITAFISITLNWRSPILYMQQDNISRKQVRALASLALREITRFVLQTSHSATGWSNNSRHTPAECLACYLTVRYMTYGLVTVSKYWHSRRWLSDTFRIRHSIRYGGLDSISNHA